MLSTSLCLYAFGGSYSNPDDACDHVDQWAERGAFPTICSKHESGVRGSFSQVCSSWAKENKFMLSYFDRVYVSVGVWVLSAGAGRSGDFNVLIGLFVRSWLIKGRKGGKALANWSSKETCYVMSHKPICVSDAFPRAFLTCFWSESRSVALSGVQRGREEVLKHG